MTNEFEALVDLFDHLIYDAQGEMYHRINFDPKDLRLSAPEFIFEMFQRGLQFRYMWNEKPGAGKAFVYKVLTFIPCYELEIAVWHKDYPLYKKDWMLRKIPLQSPFIVHNGMYDKYLFSFRPLLEKYSPKDSSKMN